MRSTPTSFPSPAKEDEQAKGVRGLLKGEVVFFLKKKTFFFLLLLLLVGLGTLSSGNSPWFASASHFRLRRKKLAAMAVVVSSSVAAELSPSMESLFSRYEGCKR